MDEALQTEIAHLRNLVNQHIGFRPSLPTANVPHVDTGIFFSANQFIAINSTPDLAGRGSGNAYYWMPGWALAAIGDELVTTTFFSNLANFSVTIFLACPNGNAGAVSMKYYLGAAGLTDQIDTSTVVNETATITVPGVTDQLFSYKFTPTNYILKDKIARLVVWRGGGDAGDTYASDVWFLGALIQ